VLKFKRKFRRLKVNTQFLKRLGILRPAERLFLVKKVYKFHAINSTVYWKAVLIYL